jgi:hypothetical protein
VRPTVASTGDPCAGFACTVVFIETVLPAIAV